MLSFSIHSVQDGCRLSFPACSGNRLIFLLKGAVRQLAPLRMDKIGEPVTPHYTAGNIVFFTAAESFDWYFRVRGEVLVVGFSGTAAQLKEIRQLLERKYDHPLEEKRGVINVRFPLNLLIMQVSGYIRDGRMDLRLSRLKWEELLLIFRHYYDGPEVDSLFAPLIAAEPEFRLLVYARYAPGMNAAELARACHMERRTFEKHFREAFGRTPLQWLEEERREQVLSALADTGRRMKDLVSEFGFCDLSHFHKFCRRHFGTGPEEMRRRILQHTGPDEAAERPGSSRESGNEPE